MKNSLKLFFIGLIAGSIHFCSSSTSTGTAQNDLVSMTADPIASDLGVESTITVSIESLDLDGVVELDIDQSSLDSDFQVDDDIVLSLSESLINLSKGQTSTVSLNVEVKASAPSFDDGKIKIIATLPNDETLELEIPFQVIPRYEIRLLVNSGNGEHTWDRPLIENFRHHEGDLEVVFINMDHLAAHRVHASGGIDHQNVDMDAAPSEGEEGGTYEVVVNQNFNSSSYYCHTHGTGDGTWLMNFNVDL